MRRQGVIVLAIVALTTLGAGTNTTAQTIKLDPVVSGLSSPVYLTHAGDGSGRLFIVEQAGRIRIHDGAQLLPTPFLDINGLVSCCNERGLLGLAFHPQYTSNGFFYVNYTDNAGDTVVARYTVSGNPNVADPGSAMVVLTVDQPFANHNGGQIEFGPDGYLYIGMGDGGSGGDPQNNGQTITTLLGKMLRIDVDAAPPYGIPPDNPYVGIAGRDEIWATGLRNPWRFSFDLLTGDMFIGDVGQNRREEIDFQPASSTGCENYGWRLMEGSLCFNPSSNCSPGQPTGCNPTGALELPILEYAHQNNPCDSVTGGYRYRGTQVPSLDGWYLYGDYCYGAIWGAFEPVGEGAGAPTAWVSKQLYDAPFFLSSFGQDEDGELYVLDVGGTAYRITGPDMQVTVNGTCPGPVEVTITGAPPSSEVALVSAANRQGWTKGGALCNGTIFEIGEPFTLPPTQVPIDGSGMGVGNMTLAPNRCWIEALAFETCETADAAKVP